jgi:hypothetical protein
MGWVLSDGWEFWSLVFAAVETKAFLSSERDGFE